MTRLCVSASGLTAVPVRVCQKSRVTPLPSCSVRSVTEMCSDRQGAISAGSRLFMTNCEVSPQTVGGLVLTPAAAASATPSHHSLHTSSLEPFLLLRPRAAPCALTNQGARSPCSTPLLDCLKVRPVSEPSLLTCWCFASLRPHPRPPLAFLLDCSCDTLAIAT